MNSHPSEPRTTASPLVTLIVVSLVQFVTPFLMSAVNVALPVIGRDFHASAVQLSLSMTLYVLSSGMTLLPVGRLADIFGRKRVFIAGTVILGISTLATGLVGSIYSFLALRLVQGFGSGMILATSVAILSSVFPPERRGRAFGITVSMVYIGLTLGPTCSGFIVRYLGWRWVFFISAGLIAATLVLTLAWLKGEWITAKGEPFDKSGSVVYMVSLGLIVAGASWLTKSFAAAWVLAGGIIGMALFFRIEWKKAHPLLEVRLLITNLPFTFSNLATFLNYAAASSFMFLFSLYLQYVQGMTPAQAGVLLIVQPIIQSVLAPLAGRLSEVYPPPNIATAGMGICTAALLAASAIGAETSLPYIVFVMVLLGISLGIFSTPNMTAIMNSVGPRHQGTASSMVATMRALGMLWSATSMAVIFSLYLGDAPVTRETVPGFVDAMQTGLYLFTALSLMGTVFSFVKGRISSTATAKSQ